MSRYTVDDILKLEPCSPYTRREIRKLWGKRKSLSLASIMKLGIPVADKLWVACYLLDHRSLVAWACDCAERTLPIFEKKYPEDKRPRNAIEVTRAWLAGKATLKEVETAADAADADAAAVPYDAFAANSAAIYAAANSATYATCATYANSAAPAADAAANSATCATYAAYAAYAAPAADAERAWQFERLLEYIRGEVTL